MYNEGCDPLRIWEVTRATSAAPFYFKSLEAVVSDELVTFKDGGIRANNPSGAAWSEFISLYGEQRDPGLLLSVGTGMPNQANDGFASAWPGPFGRFALTKKAAEKFAVFKNVLIKYTEGEDMHRAMLHNARGEHRWYKRLNVSTGLEKMKLDNWEAGPWRAPRPTTTTTSSSSSFPATAAGAPAPTVPGGASLARMESATAAYLSRDADRAFDTYAAPKVMLSQAAEKLARARRERERSSPRYERRWQTFMGRWLTGELGDEDTVLRR